MTSIATTTQTPQLQDDNLSSSPAADSLVKADNNNVALPSKAAAELYGYGDCGTSCASSNPYSLNKLMSNRKSFKNLHTSFVRDMESRREMKSVAFTDYGYGDAAPDETEPPNKRRRFQRRNSKTPAMLMKMRSPLINLDFLAELEKETKETEEEKPKPKSGDDEDNWDGGLEIAEELVKQLRNRRRSSAGGSST